MKRQEGKNDFVFSAIAKRLFASFMFACVLVATGYSGLLRASAAVSPSRIVIYQGRLLNSNNVPVSDATASMSFALYTAASGGTCLWSNNDSACASVVARTVTLTSGLFSEPLGDTNVGTPYAAIPATVFANNSGVFLEVIVNGETLTPRKQMFAAPFAINSDVLDGYDTSLVGATTSVVPVTDATGNLLLTGSPQGTGVSQGTLYINPAAGVVAANETLFGAAVDGSVRMTLDGEGDALFTGDVAVNGGDLTSTGILRVTSGGGAGLTLTSASGLVSVTTANDFSVGASSLSAPFSIDESLNEVRIGDGADDANEPGITFYASDATDSGRLSFTDADTFSFLGGKITGIYAYDLSAISDGTHNSLTSTSTISGTSGAAADQNVSALQGVSSYSGALGAGAVSTILGVSGSVNISTDSAVLTQGIGVYGNVYNQSTHATAVNGSGYLAGGSFRVVHDASQTVSLAYGMYGTITASQGTVTSGAAVMGELLDGSGAVTTGYGGRFLNITEGTNRYGVYGEASGGTANFAGYFAGGRVQVDTDSSPDTPVIANGAGDIYASDALEIHGSGRFGDTTGTDDFQFTSASTGTAVVSIFGGSLTAGTGLMIQRANDAGVAAFSGKMIDLQMLDVSSGSGVGLYVNNQVAGTSIGAHLVQTNVTNQTDAAGGTSIGGQALVLETPEAGSNDDIMLIRSNSQVVFAIETDGSVLSDGAYSGAGADYAEYFPSTDPTMTFYEMVCVDTTRPLSVKRCAAGEADPFGVMSSDPGFIGNLPDVGETGNVLVGMIGQIDTQVNANEGAIAIGDPITTSSISAGYGAKAHGPARIVGFALEPLATGTGIIKVLVQPQWYAGNVFTRDGSATKVVGSLAIAALTSATSADTAVDSADLQFRGSVWSGGAAVTRGMSLRTTVSATDDYRLSMKNNDGLEVASVNQSGDFALAGKFYPSDRGAMQSSAYIYFDGSSGIGGSFMRTNASGWATGSYDFAEMFPSSDALRPGEVVVFGDTSQAVKRSTGETYSRTIAGIVSTRPGFLAGDNVPGSYPIALAGRVPTFVSSENGPISIGDPLTTASTPGYAMRATEPGPIVGYATEAFSGTRGSIVAFVNASYYAGAPASSGPGTVNSVSRLAADIEQFDIVGALNFNGGRLLSVGSIASASGAWRLESNGDIFTSGRLVQLVQSSTGTVVETYAATSREMTVQLSGTVELEHGRATVHFDDVDVDFTGIIDELPSYRTLVTPYGATGSLYVTNRTVDGFEIVESGQSSNGIAVDWIVIAYRRGYAPVVTGSPAVTPPSFTQPIIEVMTDAGEAPVETSLGESNETNSEEGVVADSIDAPLVPSGEGSGQDPVLDDESSDTAPNTDSVSAPGLTPDPEPASTSASDPMPMPESAPVSDSVAL